MNCRICGEPLAADTEVCERCRAEEPIHVLSKQEREAFSGVTLEQDGAAREQARDDAWQEPKVRYVRYVGTQHWGWAIAAVAAIASLLVFFVLPVVIAVLGAAGLAWLWRRLWR